MKLCSYFTIPNTTVSSILNEQLEKFTSDWTELGLLS